MKILHITHTDIRFDNRIIKEIEALAEIENYQIMGIGMAFDEGAAENSLNHINADIKTLNIRSKRIKYIPRPLRHFLVFCELLMRVLSIASKYKPNIIHCHDTLVLPMGWIIKLFNKKRKLIYDAHELESNKNGQSRIHSLITLLLERVCWKKVDFLITVSPSIEDWYNKSLGDKKSAIILNSPSFNKSNDHSNHSDIYQGDYFRNNFRIPSDKLIYIYVGALAQGRCIDLMLKVFSSENISSHIVFVGFGPLKDEILKESKKHSNIHYHKAVPHDLVVDLIKNADIGMCLIENISLSDYYSLPNKLFEYSFSGLSVLGSNFPDIRSLIEKYHLGDFCDINYNSISKAIVEAEQKPPIKKINNDLSHLSWETQANNLKNVYNIIIGK